MEKRIYKIRALAFDIDGTLYTNMAMYRATALFALRHVRLFLAFGRARKLVRQEYPLQDLGERTVELTAKELEWDTERTRKALQKVIYREWEQRLRSVQLCDGARELLVWLRRAGIRTAAMSDFPVAGKLSVLGLEGLWNVAFSSEETGYLKPRAEPFNRLIAELKLPAEEILYVGNSYEYDVLGASAVGIPAAHFTWRTPRESKAVFTFSRYSDLQEWLKPRIMPAELD
ncbi:MAG: HAD family hydrolase [Spirochaetaceae bacterium]|nr:MAG: HAD family hydrolase [Spirochaetaceae bacterium]